jgi:hypothetical protein
VSTKTGDPHQDGWSTPRREDVKRGPPAVILLPPAVILLPPVVILLLPAVMFAMLMLAMMISA